MEYKPGTRVVYSDLGFITLGLLLERAGGKTLAELAQAEIFTPLGLKQTFFNPEAAMQTGIAACESSNAYEREMYRELDDAPNWRRELIWGNVHDGNAYFLGGAAGHAGLFSTAAETLVHREPISCWRSKLLKPETCDLFRTNLSNRIRRSPIVWLATRPNKRFRGGPGSAGGQLWSSVSLERVVGTIQKPTNIYSSDQPYPRARLALRQHQLRPTPVS